MTEVVVHSQTGLTQRVEVRDHELVADEPLEGGGADLGPNPYELLLAALGSCTAMTVRLYAQRRGWPLEGITVVLQHERVHALDCANCETREGSLDKVTKRLSLTGPLSAEQRERLGQIAERCPVQRTLQHPLVVEQHLLVDPRD
jgi:putative redox protein